MPSHNKHPESDHRRYDHPGDAWNAGKPWSEWCVYSLLYQYQKGGNIEDIAISIQRPPEEIEAKIKELCLDKMTPSQLKEGVERAGPKL